MMKTLRLLFSVLFFLLAAAVGVSALVCPQKSFSETENRPLKTRRDLTFSFSSGQLAENAERVLCEQFPLRDQAVKAWSAAVLLSGRRDLNGAYIGKGRLFQKITAADASASNAQKEADKLSRLKAAFPDLPVFIMPVPAAGTQLPQLLPDYAAMYDPQPFYDAFLRLSGCTVVDLRPALTDPADYYKTDHHWTLQGAYKAYALWRQAKGSAAPAPESFQPQVVSDAFFGALSSKAPGAPVPPDTISIISVPTGLSVTADGGEGAVYDLSALTEKDKYRVYFGGNYGIVDVRNPASSGGNLLILKDSFANSFVPFLLSDYARVVLADDRYVAVSLSELVETYGITEVLYLKTIVQIQ